MCHRTHATATALSCTWVGARDAVYGAGRRPRPLLHAGARVAELFGRTCLRIAAAVRGDLGLSRQASALVLGSGGTRAPFAGHLSTCVAHKPCNICVCTCDQKHRP
jgi:hypothetical protein